MIAPLRRRHRVIFIVLGVLLPVLFALALRARQPVPRSAPLAEEPTAGAPSGD